MSTDRRIVVASLVWVGVLVALSRSWLGDVRNYVRGKAGRAPATPGTSGKSGLGPDGQAGGGGGGGGGGSW